MLDKFDVSTALRFSPINPLVVQQVVAGWKRDDLFGYDWSVGFIVELPGNHPMGRYAYIVLTVEGSVSRESVSTQYFKSLPGHLYERAADWAIGGPTIAQINKDLGYSKAHAQHGTSTSSLDPFKTD
jgi:hypothetical protein